MMSEEIRFVVAVLACWRLAAALYFENGPGDVWLRVRLWAQGHSPFLQQQLSCFWCCTGIAALIVWPFYVWLPWLLVPVALSGAAALLSHGGRIIWQEMKDGG